MRYCLLLMMVYFVESNRKVIYISYFVGIPPLNCRPVLAQPGDP